MYMCTTSSIDPESDTDVVEPSKKYIEQKSMNRVSGICGGFPPIGHFDEYF